VIKHEVEKSWCENCKKWKQKIPLPNSEVVLGPNVQKYVCYLSVMRRLSFTQIQNLLYDTYQIQISQGEISKILDRESIHLGPFYEQLKEKIRDEPAAHLDETGWKLFTDPDKSFSWVMSGSQSKESVFLIGENRGKGNADKLLGAYDGVVVTDDYGAYRKLENHQLCWAHLLRKFRDLANSQELNENQSDYCKKEYSKLCLIYSDLKEKRQIKNYDKFYKKLFNFSKIRANEPRKMARLKTTFLKNIPNYLTCLKDPDIPMTNNLAERSLRHLVLKRKISFGSFAKRTADNLAILLSCLMSLKQRHGSNFFTEYLRV
jgi:transposase